jgi:hypothetical protein
VADTIDPRFGQPLWADDNSTFPGVAGWTAIFQAIYGKSAIGRHGLTSAMGSPSVPDVFYWATDTKRLWCSGAGTAWTEVSPVGGGGLPLGQPYNGIKSPPDEGTSRIAARADHKHPEPAWPIALYEFERQSANSYDSFTPGHMAGVMSGSFTGPAGLYLFGATAVVSTQSAATDAYTVGYLRYTVNGVNLTEDSRCDMSRIAQSVSFTKAKAVGAGTVTLNLYLQTSSANGSIYTNGSHIWAAFLGPN